MSTHVTSGSAALAALLALLCTSVGAQVPPPPSPEEQQQEEQWIQMKIDQGESHASGARPELGPVILGNPTQAVATLRVGLYYSFTSSGAYSEFFTLSHPFADISHTAGDVHVLDGATGKQIAAIAAGALTHVTFDGAGYQVSVDGVFLGSFGGPIFFKPTQATNEFRVESIRRGTTAFVPRYRGAIEISRGTPTTAGRLNVINIVELEDYVPGVVTNESLNSFHVEALKAQAIAARGYAVANIGRFARSGWPFDIVDSSSSQVYRGVMSETVKGRQASTDTSGLVASYNGQIISALYSSSFGGHSEHNEWIFNSPSSQLPGTNATPYLRGIYDGDGVAPDFTSDAGIASFWTALQPDTFDDCPRVSNARNRFSRWRIVLSPGYIRTRMNLSGRSVVISGNTTGTVTDVEITRRMGASARAAVARITLTTGVAEVRGWDNLRNVLGRSEVITPPLCTGSNIIAGFVLNNPSVVEVVRNPDSSLSHVVSWGGGWGHNVGLSQYGSNGRAWSGQNFLEILKGYYTGVDVGSYPIDIGRDPGTGPPMLRQQFMAPSARGTLVVRSTDLKGLRVHVNEAWDISLDEAALGSGTVSVDLSPYLVAGINSVQYNPVGRDGRATVTVAIE